MNKNEVKKLLKSIRKMYVDIDICHDLEQRHLEHWDCIRCRPIIKKYCRELDQDIKKEESEIIHLSQNVRKLDSDVEVTILFLRYFCMWKWEDIAEKVGYSCEHTQILHSKALSNLCTIMRPFDRIV